VKPLEETREDAFCAASDGVRIAVTHYRIGSSARLVIAPGFWRERGVEEMIFLARWFTRRGYDVTSFDFRGHGQSEGEYTFGLKEWRDVESVLAQGSGYARQAVVGFSLGGAIAADALVRRPEMAVDALIMISSPADLLEVRPRVWKSGARRQLSLKRALKPPRLDMAALPRRKPAALDAVARLTVPKLIVTTQDDWLVAETHGVRLLEAAAPPVEHVHLTLPGSLHADALVRFAPRALLRALESFLERYVPVPARRGTGPPTPRRPPVGGDKA
jgi:pimeloyl-ACP methyl ester carboxylesterase